MTLRSKLNRKRGAWILLALLAGILALLGGRGPAKASAQASQPQAETKGAPAAKSSGWQAPTKITVAEGEISRTLLITGELQAVRSREIKAPAPRSSAFSTITYLAEEGSTVRQGQKLVEFDSTALVSNLSEAQRSVDEAVLTIEKTKRDLEASRCDMLSSLATAEGNLKIAELNAAIPEDIQPENTFKKYQLEYQKAKLNLDKAKEQLANFEANYESKVNLAVIQKSQAEINLKRMEGDLKLLSIDAPQDGVVIYGDNWASNRKYQIGDQAFPDQTIIILPDLSAMKVSGFVYDTELQFLTPGMPCEIRLDAVPKRSWKGKIESISSVASRKGFTTQVKVFKATILLDSVDLAVMRPGMTAHAEISVSMASGAVAVPRTHLGLDALGQYYVLKDKGEKNPPEPVVVKVGAFGDQMIQILSGANVGDRLIPIYKTSGE